MIARKWGAALLAGVMMLTVAGTALAAPTVPGALYEYARVAGFNKPVTQVQQELQQAGIHDVKPTDWFAGSVTVIVQAGLLKPATDGSFKPEANVNSAEGVAAFAKVLGIASKTDSDQEAAAKMQQAGLVSGSVSADRDMTRLEVARMIALALGVQPRSWLTPLTYPWGDYGQVSQEDARILAALYDVGVFKGFPDGNFHPDGILTRAQIALLIDRILGAAQ